MYIISNLDETKFITLDAFGKFTWNTNKSNACHYTKIKAQNVINNCLTKPTTNYKILEHIEPIVENQQTAIDSIENITKTHIMDCDWDKELEFDVMQSAISYKSMLNSLENEKILLNNKLIILSRAMVDLYHYKELNNKLSAITICRLHKFEVGVLTKRRECKDRLFFVDRLLDELHGKDTQQDIDTFLNTHHEYRVRVLDGLFESNNIGDFDEWWESVLEGRGHESKTVSATTE